MTNNMEQKDLQHFRNKLLADPTNEKLSKQLALLEAADIINRINKDVK